MGTKNAKPHPPSTTRANPLSFPLPPLMRPANLPNPFDMKESDILECIRSMQEKRERPGTGD